MSIHKISRLHFNKMFFTLRRMILCKTLKKGSQMFSSIPIYPNSVSSNSIFSIGPSHIRNALQIKINQILPVYKKRIASFALILKHKRYNTYSYTDLYLLHTHSILSSPPICCHSNTALSFTSHRKHKLLQTFWHTHENLFTLTKLSSPRR